MNFNLKRLFPALILTSALVPTLAQGQTLDSEQSAFLTLINNYRAQNGAGALQVSAALQNSSMWMSTDMATKNYFSHTDSLGRDPGTRIASFGYTYYPWGENIAAGNSDAQNTLNQWINACDADASGVCTYAHRMNMLNPSFKAIGIGRAYGASSTYRWYWTTDFGGVVDSTPTPPPAPAPTISSFSASPSSINAAQAANLSWSVSGATSLTIDNGVGTVTGLTSKSVAPSQTTTYTLTASNGSGSSTARATVTVNAVTKDTQAPSIPVITSATAASSKEVDLNWSASNDNVGVTGYQIFRNGTLLTSVSGATLSYADLTVTPSTAYSYTLKAYDAAGNTSSSSGAAGVTTPAAPVSGNCAPVAGAFTGCYYNNTTLSGTPVLQRTDNQINFDWWFGSPGPALSPGNFSARWQGTFTFAQASYLFTVTASDGIRLYIDGALVLNQWKDQAASSYSVIQNLSAGSHLIVVEYYEHTGLGSAHLTWQYNGPAPQTPAITAFSASPTSITAGQPATLSWAVSGATSVTIDNGIGSVTNLTSTVVYPATTTTYVLTATNASGSTTAQATVTVNTAVTDKQPPSTPTLTSATAKGPGEVDLAWTASNDNVGVTGYQISRNGSVLTSVSGATLAYADTSVNASTNYSYSVKAYDAAGNFSAQSNTMQTGTPAPPVSGSCSAATGAFTGCYYNNTTLTGIPVQTRTDSQINFDWTGFNPSPGPQVTANNFSVRWQGIFNFAQGNYTFTAITSDGVRVYIDGKLVINQWNDHLPSIYTAQQSLSQGNHLIVMEYYEHSGFASAHLSWQ